MNTKVMIWIGMFVGSTVAGFIPELWGSSFLSMAGFFCSVAGALIGIWAGYKLANSL